MSKKFTIIYGIIVILVILYFIFNPFDNPQLDIVVSMSLITITAFYTYGNRKGKTK